LAVKPQNDEAFLREVDEELRRAQLGSFWSRYGRWVVIAAILAIAGFGGTLWWRHAQQQKRGLAGEEMTAALMDMSKSKPDAAKPRLDKLADGSIAGYRALAKLTLADAALDKRDDKGATATLAALAADSSVDQPFRDLALIRQTAIEFDTLPPATVVARLKPLAIEGNPWFGSAGEMVALSYLKMGKRELAGPIFGALAKDQDVPQSIRGRAAKLAGALGQDVVAQPQGPAKE
jgi:hypothetical protein